jgi:hypothetical protein
MRVDVTLAQLIAQLIGEAAQCRYAGLRRFV